MTLSSRTKYYITETICLLFILLFIYASASKLMDFQHFRIQLGQSPLLSAFAEQLAVIVPLFEIIICILLLIPKYKPLGLFASYGIMVMFTAYIFIILNYTSFIPCSCGGVLEKLSWQSHMIFNLAFVFLSVLAIILYEKKDKSLYLKKGFIVGVFSSVTIASVSVVTALFMLSENIIHYHNTLTRRFPQTPIRQIATSDLKLNSFYFAGLDSSDIYLGNTTAPLVITKLNSRLEQTQRKKIDLDNKKLPFRAASIMVETPYFFVTDGTVPCIFKGRIDNWNAKLILRKGEYFTTARVIDSNAITVVSAKRTNGDNVLAVIDLLDNGRTTLNPEILQKQNDGVFDTDGMLVYSREMKRIIYLYAYRNQFTIADKRLKIDYRSSTIDTITKAQLHIENDENFRQRQFSKPPLFVNKNCAVFGNLLFVQSAIPGRFEDDKIWKHSSIIDVYDLRKKSYVLSFCISDLNGKKMRYFKVLDDKMYVLIGTHIIVYKLDSKITTHYASQSVDNLLAK